MIDYNVYKLIHLFSIFGLFLALGAASVTDRSQARWAAPVHGIALVLIIVAGFGMLARLGIHGALPKWVIAKLVIWLALGASLTLARRKKLPVIGMISIFAILGGAAAAFALWKP